MEFVQACRNLLQRALEHGQIDVTMITHGPIGMYLEIALGHYLDDDELVTDGLQIEVARRTAPHTLELLGFAWLMKSQRRLTMHVNVELKPTEDRLAALTCQLGLRPAGALADCYGPLDHHEAQRLRKRLLANDAFPPGEWSVTLRLL